MGTNTQGRTCEHDRGYYGYVDSSTGDCPYCKLRTMEAKVERLESLCREVVEASERAVRETSPQRPYLQPDYLLVPIDKLRKEVG